MENLTAIRMGIEYKSLNAGLETLEENESIFCDKNIEMVLTASAIRTYLATKSKGSKCYVLAETDIRYEIIRLPDNADANFFYETISTKTVSETNTDKLIRLLEIYQSKTFDKLTNIDHKLTSEMKNKNIITYSYLQRYTSTIGSFKRSVIGATKTLHLVIQQLIDSGLLIELNKADTVKHFKSGARMFKINK